MPQPRPSFSFIMSQKNSTLAAVFSGARSLASVIREGSTETSSQPTAPQPPKKPTEAPTDDFQTPFYTPGTNGAKQTSPEPQAPSKSPNKRPIEPIEDDSSDEDKNKASKESKELEELKPVKRQRTLPLKAPPPCNVNAKIELSELILPIIVATVSASLNLANTNEIFTVHGTVKENNGMRRVFYCQTCNNKEIVKVSGEDLCLQCLMRIVLPRIKEHLAQLHIDFNFDANTIRPLYTNVITALMNGNSFYMARYRMTAEKLKLDDKE